MQLSSLSFYIHSSSLRQQTTFSSIITSQQLLHRCRTFLQPSITNGNRQHIPVKDNSTPHHIQATTPAEVSGVVLTVCPQCWHLTLVWLATLQEGFIPFINYDSEQQLINLICVHPVVYQFKALQKFNSDSEMIKYFKRVFPALTRRTFACFSQDKPAEDVSQKSLILKPKHNKQHEFLPNVYAHVTEIPIIPHQTKAINLNSTKLKFHKKYSPNYIAAIVKKHASDQNLPLSQQFGTIATYCRINYKNDRTTLTALYRIQIEDIKKIEMEAEQSVNIIEEDKELDHNIEPNHDQTTKNPNHNKILNYLKRQESTKLFQNQVNEFYALKIKKLDEPTINLTLELEAKLKFLIESYIKLYSLHPANFPHNFNLYEGARIIDTIAIELSERQYISVKQFQEFIEKIDIEERIEKVQQMLNKSLSFSNYLNDLEKIAQQRIKEKKFFQYYQEIMKIAKQAVEGQRAKDLFIQNATKSFIEKNPSDEVKKIFKQQCERYSQTDEQSSESSVIKTYIEQLSKIPYNVKSYEAFDIKLALEALDSEHYGMKQVKEEILQLIAVGKLKGTLKGKALCFIGPPGLGKTTLASSIAKALNRKFYNISLGGITDSSALKGHRRTYVGAYSGKIINALKSCGTSNPVILLDEIDKMGRSNQGDPRSELLQILDPNQNTSFVDNYVDFPVDLSNVLFICSANYINNISKPLQDRLQKIYLTSYTNNEKKQIFQRHILKRAVQDVGLKPQQFTINQQTTDMLILDYSRGQPGVRYLQKSTKKLLEKIALKVVKQEQPLPIQVNKANIESYLGLPFFNLKDHTKIKTGVAVGLGDSVYGGRLTYIQAVKRSFMKNDGHKRGLLLTGSLGNIIKEAMDISYTFARNFLKQHLQNTYLYQNEVHIHAPEGASKKDGPNDSITIATALISLAINKEVKKGIAMTGQLSLKGKVLKAADCKQKVLIAKRQKISQVIIPKANKYEIESLTDDIKENITFHFVEDYEDVFKIVF